MIASAEEQRCEPVEWAAFRRLVQHGMLFEVIEWIDKGKPTLRPAGKHTSAFEDAALAPNLSMTQVLWERAWQERKEASRVLYEVASHHNSVFVMRYLLKNGCPADKVFGHDLCLFHDLELIRLGMSRGVSILEPEGWASAFVHVGSRPLIRFYLEERDRIPGLRKDAVWAMCKCIKESRLRAAGLLRWAGVDPLGPAPRYDDFDDPEEEWDGFPARHLDYAQKAGELIKLFKLKPTTEQWFQILRNVAVGNHEAFDDVFHIIKKPEETLLAEPDQSAMIICDLIQSICWGYYWYSDRYKQLAELSVRLIDLGVQLWFKDRNEILMIRRYILRSESHALIFKILSKAVERAGERSKADLALLVQTPKMRELVIKYDAKILQHLGLKGPAYYDSHSDNRKSATRRTFISAARDRLPPSNPIDRAHSAQPPLKVSSEKPSSYAGHTSKHHGGRVLSREEIYKDVWTKATMHVAEGYGISGSMLARICTKLQIPRPPRGYWARPVKERKGMQPKLPKWKSDEVDFWAINPTNVKAQKGKKS